MARNQRIVRMTLLVAVLLMSLFSIGPAQAQGQSPAYAGTFTTTNQIHWGKTVLQPGTYTITIKSTGNPIVASIRNAKGDAVTYVASGARSGNDKWRECAPHQRKEWTTRGAFAGARRLGNGPDL